MSMQFDELRANMNVANQYGGPHKVVPAAPIERPMTNAEKLKAEKEQLKLK